MDSQSGDVYVTWEVGAKTMEVSKGVFFYEVKQGRIIEDSSRDEKDGKYLLSSILTRKVERATKKPRKPYRQRRPPVVYDWITPRDIPVVLKLDQERYGEIETDFEINYQEIGAYQEQYKKNPFISMAAWVPNKQECLAYIALVPIPEQVALAIMAGKRDESNLTLDEIETYDRPGGFSLLCRSVVTKRDYEYLLTGILKRIMGYWVERYPEQYILRIYTQTVSNQGVRLLRHLFLMPMAGYPDNAYYLDFARFNPSRLVRGFLEDLEEKAPLPEVLCTRFTPPLPSN